MKVRTLVTTGTLGVSGLLAAGLLALPGASSSSAAGDERYAKRDDDTPEVVLVADEDDDDTNARQARDTNTVTRDNTNTRATRSNANTNSGVDTRSNNNTRSRTNDRTGTGAQTGRDDSRQRVQKDWTTDGPGAQKRDWSANSTNDRSRNNTRRGR